MYSSVIDIRFIVSYPKITLKLKAADCTKRALRPLLNIIKPSSLHKSLNARDIDSIRWTCNRARTTSKGLVKIVVVKPPTDPAMLCTTSCGVLSGRIVNNSSKKSKINSKI